MRKWLIVCVGTFVAAVGFMSLQRPQPHVTTKSEILTTVSGVSVVEPSSVSSGPSVDYGGEVLKVYGEQLKLREEWAGAGYAAYVANQKHTVLPQRTVRAAPVAPGSSPGGFLGCVRNRESRGNYSVVNPASGAAGAYQFMPQTAKNTANHAGRPDLAAIPVTQWSPADQDAMASHLLQWQGPSPWAGPGCG